MEGTPSSPGEQCSSSLKTDASDSSKVIAHELPLLPEVVERLGFGLAQLRAGFIGGGVYLADGSELLLISAVTDAVANQWSLGAFQRGMVVTIVFLGILVGNFISGPIGDSYGRRHLILASFTGIFTFSILSSLALGFATLSAARFFVGLSFGIGQPAWNTLGAEVTPSDWRVAMQAISQGFFILGEAYSSVLLLWDDASMKELHWRWLLQMGAIPSVLFLVAGVLWLEQSPSYLAMTHQHEEARRVLESIRRDNGAMDVPVDFTLARKRSQVKGKFRRSLRRTTIESRQDLFRQLRIVFGPSYWYSTLIVMYSCFVLNLLYYGCLYAFPQVLPQAGASSQLPAVELLVGCLWELPGQALGIILGTLLTRKLNMKVYLATTFLSLLSFTVTLPFNTKASAVFNSLGYYGIKCFVDIGFVVVYQYSIEIYPAVARTTGTAICMGSGRVAGIISPLVFEMLHHATGSFVMFFSLLAASTVVNFCLIDLLKYETFGMTLSDDSPDDAVVQKDEANEAAPLVEKAEQPPLMPEPIHPR